MDTNLKKTHKLAILLITVTILAAALAITCLYPRTGAAMEILRDQYEKEYAEYSSELSEYCVENSFVNYALEASYYMFGFLLQECEGRAVDFSVLDEYGWDSDYHLITEQCEYLAVYRDIVGVPEISRPVGIDTDSLQEHTESTEAPVVNTDSDSVDSSDTAAAAQMQSIISDDMTEAQECTSVQDVIAAGSNTDLWPLLDGSLTEEQLLAMNDAGILGYLTLEYDAYGKLTDADIRYTADNVRFYGESTYKTAKRSIEQYQRNIIGYQAEFDEYGDYYQVMPKNFRAVFLIHENGGFVFREDHNPYYIYSSEKLYWETGAAFVIIAIALFVAVVALLLPFIRSLHTGWERLFSIHIEVVVSIAVIGGLSAYGMMLFMANTNMYEIMHHIEYNGNIVFLGYVLDPSTIYYGLLVLNFLGWAGCFLMEYIVIAAVRQFLSSPGYYLGNRFLIVCIIRWLFRPFKKLYNYVTDIDISHRLKNSILKIVIANFVLVTFLCCMWFAGIIGVLIYSAALYIILKKFGSRLQKQYHSIIHATKKMANGDLKITLDEDLGIFEPIGDELTKIQQGFSKAVAEEAKSQNMKTELITNVSHDLKTPLTAIITYVNLLKNPDISDEERANYIDTLDQKTQRLKVLIEDLFEVSKAHSGNIKMNFMDVDVVSLMKQVRLEMEDQIADCDLYFRWNLPEEKVILKLDGQRTYRVFVNLINNILKYSMPGSRVFIDISAEDESVRIHFRNISKAELDFDVEKLTDRFVRGDESRNTEGSGLGLAIAKSFVELQNGTFKIDVDGDLFKATITWPR